MAISASLRLFSFFLSAHICSESKPEWQEGGAPQLKLYRVWDVLENRGRHGVGTAEYAVGPNQGYLTAWKTTTHASPVLVPTEALEILCAWIKSFLTQEHPLGLTLEMRPEVKRWHKRKNLCCTKLLIPSSAPGFSSISDSCSVFGPCLVPYVLECRSCVSETPPSLFQFCALFPTSSLPLTQRVCSVLLAL